MRKISLPIGFVFFVAAICLLLFVLEVVNHRLWLNDFKVYYESAVAIFSGNQLYGVARGLDSGFYKYSPFILFFYSPFLLVQFKIAAIIYYLIMIGFIFEIFILVKRLLNRHLFNTELFNNAFLFILIFLFVFVHINRELHLGNTNLLLLMLLLLALDFIVSEKQIRGGIILGIAFLFKPFLALLLLPLVMHKKWKTLASLAIFTVLQFMFMFLFWGPAKTVSLHTDWISTILNHSNNYLSTNSLAYMLDFYLGIKHIPYLNFIALFAISILYLIFWFFNNRKRILMPEKTLSANDYLLIESFLLMAIIPNILNTDTEHFLFSIPVISVLVFYLYIKRSYTLTALLFVIFLFYGINSNDLVGNTIGTFFDKIGAIGLANLGLMLFLVIVLFSDLPIRKPTLPDYNSS